MYLIIRSLAFSSRKPASSRSVPFRLGKRWQMDRKTAWRVWQAPQEISYKMMKNWKSIISLKKLKTYISSSYQNHVHDSMTWNVPLENYSCRSGCASVNTHAHQKRWFASTPSTSIAPHLWVRLRSSVERNVTEIWVPQQQPTNNQRTKSR